MVSTKTFLLKLDFESISKLFFFLLSQIMLKPQGEVNEETINAIFANVGKTLEVEVLSRLRNYITIAKMRSFDISEEAMNFVQEDFVRERQNANSQVKTSDDLHTLLVLVRGSFNSKLSSKDSLDLGFLTVPKGFLGFLMVP